MRKIFFITILFFVLFSLGACKKYLAGKPDQSLSVPSSAEDLKLLLANFSLFNGGYPTAGVIAADNYYLTEASWGSISEKFQKYYLWQSYDDAIANWTFPYKRILNLNIILEVNEDLKDDGKVNLKDYRFIKGNALFLRSINYFNLAEMFCVQFDSVIANKQLGIPLRLSSNIEEKSERSSLIETYNQILKDAKEALNFLDPLSEKKYYASKASDYGLLSRVYMAMQDYDLAGKFADSCLQIQSSLMDFNSDADIIIQNKEYPFNRLNKEVVYDARIPQSPAIARSRTVVDSVLYRSFDDNDLRKSLFFGYNLSNGAIYFKGNYTGKNSAEMFCGIATDEMLLNRAECNMRNGQIKLALDDLNFLLTKRWKTGTFVPYITSDLDTGLMLVLRERRKELLFRGLRWQDLRRLNKSPKTQITLRRKINGKEYVLKPNDDRYVFLIDRSAVELGGIQQNP